MNAQTKIQQASNTVTNQFNEYFKVQRITKLDLLVALVLFCL